MDNSSAEGNCYAKYPLRQLIYAHPAFGRRSRRLRLNNITIHFIALLGPLILLV